MGPTKGHFTGRNALFNRPPTTELLVGLSFTGEEAPKRGTKLIDSEGNEAGVITSAKVSPTLGKPIGFAYVQRWQSTKGTEFTVADSDVTATVVPTPFYNRRHRK